MSSGLILPCERRKEKPSPLGVRESRGGIRTALTLTSAWLCLRNLVRVAMKVERGKKKYSPVDLDAEPTKPKPGPIQKHLRLCFSKKARSSSVCALHSARHFLFVIPLLLFLLPLPPPPPPSPPLLSVIVLHIYTTRITIMPAERSRHRGGAARNFVKGSFASLHQPTEPNTSVA